MTATEIAIYAVETKAIIHILWGLLLIASVGLIGVSITYVLLRIRVRSGRRRESQLARHVAAKSTEIARLEDRMATLTVDDGIVATLKKQLRHAQGIRAKTEDRLVQQNDELEALRVRIAEQDEELAQLRVLIEHGEMHAQPRAA